MNGFVGILVLAFAAVALAGKHCPSEQADDWSIELLLPHPDCDKFFKCTYGKPVEQDCPVDLQYNIESEQCDYPRNVDCGDRNTSDDNEEVVVVDSDEEVTVVESDEEVTVVESDEEVTVVESDEEVTVVESDEEVAVPKPEPEPVESEEVEAIEFLPNGCPASPHVHWLLPSKICNQFFSCVFGKKVRRKCASSLHFNRDLQVCDYPKNAGCRRGINKPREE